MSRTRLIRPEFFADEVMADLSRDTRLVYIGLWTLCDDAGFFERRPRQIAVALFGFDADRDALVDRALGDLVVAERITWLECGKHGIVPKLPLHGQKGGTKAYTYRDRHAACVDRRRDEVARERSKRPSSRLDPSGPVRTQTDKSSSESVSESESDSEGAQARERRSLVDASIDAGGFVAQLAARRLRERGG